MEHAVRFVDSIHQVDPSAWNRLLGRGYPFLRHEYLTCLQDSGATSPDAGWRPHHAVVHATMSEQSALVAVVPLFLKSHSYAEYVFDFAWARAYQQAGLSYYPKLICCAPFAPDSGPRLLLDPSVTSEAFIVWLMRAVQAEALRLGASGVHCLFPEAKLCELLHRHGWHQRLNAQYHWFNHNHPSFDAFLATFASRKRKNVLRERKKVTQQGIEVVVKEGAEVSSTEWEDFHRFYRSTFQKLSGRNGYLNREFFVALGRAMPQSVVLIGAYRHHKLIAGALCFRDETALYGRYWGCDEEVECLHFELCYYRGIEYAIEQKLERFEPGAQGEHKIARGFVPTLTYSNHWLVHDGGRHAIEAFLREEAREIERYVKEAHTLLPFRQENED